MSKAVPRDEAYPTIRWSKFYDLHCPHRTDPISRHVKVIAEGLRDLKSPMRIALAEYEPDHMAASMEKTVIALWEARLRIQALETALAPFDRQDVEKLFEGVADEEADRHLVEVEVNLADLRRARSVLSEKPQEAPKPSEGDIVGPE